MVFFLAFVLFNETINIQTYIGGVIVIAGVIVSVYDTPNRSNKIDLYIGVLFGVIAHIFTAYSVLIVKPIMLNNSIVYVALYRFGSDFLLQFYFVNKKWI